MLTNIITLSEGDWTLVTDHKAGKHGDHPGPRQAADVLRPQFPSLATIIAAHGERLREAAERAEKVAP